MSSPERILRDPARKTGPLMVGGKMVAAELVTSLQQQDIDIKKEFQQQAVTGIIIVSLNQTQQAFDIRIIERSADKKSFNVTQLRSTPDGYAPQQQIVAGVDFGDAHVRFDRAGGVGMANDILPIAVLKVADIQGKSSTLPATTRRSTILRKQKRC